MSRVPTGAHTKDYGAFYTDEIVAGFLVRWAVRSPRDRVLDPSFGGGVFLEAAAQYLSELGGNRSAQVFGVELDSDVHERVSRELGEAHQIRAENFIRSDFFEVDPTHLAPFDAVVGNPPFIRYQRFNGEVRARARLRAQQQGVAISKLASSWAAFLVHSAALLKPGGRLAMVIPVELGHATYARSVLSYLTTTFERVTLLTFKERLFPTLSQDTLLLLAENKEATFSGLFWRDFTGPNGLAHASLASDAPERLDEGAFLSGREKLITNFIPRPARELYRSLSESSLSENAAVSRLGTLADVGVGYVTGANKFFHLSPQEAEALGIPETFLRRAVFRGAALTGLTFGEADWQRAASVGSAGYLLAVETDALPAPLQAYIKHGETLGVHETYKCRVRSPWYRVPHVYRPDAFLTYMSGSRPQLVANEAEASAPNTLHIVRLHPQADLNATSLAALWHTSLSNLSAEIEGHALGGGMLKLEPGEAARVLLARPNDRDLDGLIHDIDMPLRRGDAAEAQELADREVLQKGLGLSQKDCDLLREAAALLRQRRYGWTRKRSPQDVCHSRSDL